MTVHVPERVTASELASLLRCSVEKVYRMARNGDIPALRVGRGWRFDVADVKARLQQPDATWAQSSRSTRRARRAA